MPQIILEKFNFCFICVTALKPQYLLITTLIALNINYNSTVDQIKAFLQQFDNNSIKLTTKMTNMSLATPQQIQKHCMNNSPAKICYRFPQSKRFQQTNPECPVAFYTYSSQLSKKKTVMGTSKKIEYNAVLAETPSGTDYNPNTYHQFTKQRGKTFGASRQKNPAYLVPQVHIHPSPATYKAQKQKKQRGSFTMRPKTIDVIQKHKSYKQNPGPGDYQKSGLIRDKKSILVSRFKGPPLGVFSKTCRFSSILNSPGAQDYKKTDDLSPQGKYIVSTHKGRGTRSFTHENRFVHQHWKTNENPSPADYIKPSDFGIYGRIGLKSHQSNVI